MLLPVSMYLPGLVCCYCWLELYFTSLVLSLYECLPNICMCNVLETKESTHLRDK